MLNFEQSSLFASAGAEKITIEYFAANINLLVESDPYKGRLYGWKFFESI